MALMGSSVFCRNGRVHQDLRHLRHIGLTKPEISRLARSLYQPVGYIADEDGVHNSAVSRCIASAHRKLKEAGLPIPVRFKPEKRQREILVDPSVLSTMMEPHVRRF